MKSLITLVFALASLTVSADINVATSRSNKLLQFLVAQKGLRNIALHSVIGKRCSRYLPEHKKDACKYSVKKMIDILDFDMIVTDHKFAPTGTESWRPGSFVFVAFKKNLLTLLSQELTTTYLEDLNQRLYDYILGGKSRPNIWSVTKSHFKSDYMTAMVMASLFQDTSPMKLHLAWIERSRTRGNSFFTSNKELLDRVIDTINLVLDSSEDNYRALFYPEEIQKDLNRNIYHFYVPLFLAKDLERSARLKKEYAYTAAVLLTLSYEFITSSNDYRYLFADPKTITSLHKVKDIYGGYTGSNIGVRGMNFFKSFGVIRESFSKSTEDAVKLLLRSN